MDPSTHIQQICQHDQQGTVHLHKREIWNETLKDKEKHVSPPNSPDIKDTREIKNLLSSDISAIKATFKILKRKMNNNTAAGTQINLYQGYLATLTEILKDHILLDFTTRLNNLRQCFTQTENTLPDLYQNIRVITIFIKAIQDTQEDPNRDLFYLMLQSTFSSMTAILRWHRQNKNARLTKLRHTCRTALSAMPAAYRLISRLIKSIIGINHDRVPLQSLL